MVILGIDPGLAIMGYGAIDKDGSRIKPIDYGTVMTQSAMAFPERIDCIYGGICTLIERFKPDAIAFEELFFNKNAKTAIIIGQARGAAVAAAYRSCKALYEYTPLQVKQAVVGYGKAEKKQVQLMVKTILGLDKIPKPDDAADALAVAICHAQTCRMGESFLMK